MTFKEIIKVVSLSVLWIALLYAIFAFVMNDFNSTNWGWDTRFIFVSIVSISAYGVGSYVCILKQ